MSVISLEFGQCGNQIGNSLYSTIFEDIYAKESKDVRKNYTNYCRSPAVNKWFNVNKRGRWEPRSVLIDTECKVVQSAQPLPFKFKNIVAKPLGGSANNWACGYTRNGKILVDEVMSMVRTESEKCDLLSSFLNVCSSSGGTGSGVGSFIIEQLKDDYPNKNIASTVILPYMKGEIVTQNYNTLLTLSHLYGLVDSIILFENERLHYTCKYGLDIGDINFSHMNTVVSQQLAALFQPLNIDTPSVLNRLTSQRYKFLQIKSEPQFPKENIKFEPFRSWKTLVSTISKQSRFDFMYQNQNKLRNKTICSAVITRGLNHPLENDLKSLQCREVCVPWLTRDSSFNAYHQKHGFLNFEKYLMVVSNNNSVYMPLNFITEDAWNMFNYGAYLHHFKEYDIDEEFFLNSFQVLENILDAYKSI